jgi:hypothetical protein
MNELAKILYNVEVKTGKTKFGANYSLFYLKKLTAAKDIDFQSYGLPRGGVASIIMFYDDNAITIKPMMFYYHAPRSAQVKNSMGSARTPHNYTGPRMLSFGRGKFAVRVSITKKNHKVTRKCMQFLKKKRLPARYIGYKDEESFFRSLTSFVSQWSREHQAAMYLHPGPSQDAALQAMIDLIHTQFKECYNKIKENANERQLAQKNSGAEKSSK